MIKDEREFERFIDKDVECSEYWKLNISEFRTLLFVNEWSADTPSKIMKLFSDDFTSSTANDLAFMVSKLNMAG
jgi:hypothetical protein